MDKKQDFTQGVIWKQLLLYFFPILIGTFFQQLYNTVDTIIVGQAVGTEALAAVGSTGNLTNLIVYLFVGLSTGATVVIAQYYGARDDKRVSRGVHTSFALAIISGIIMMLFGLLFSKQCLSLIGVPLEILDAATLYMKVYFLSMIPGTIYNIGSAILRAVGDSKTPLYYLIVCSIVNVVFDYIFVVIFKTGIAGAAMATDIAQLICAILVIMKLINTNDIYQLRVKEICLDFQVLKSIIRIGVPAGLQSTMYSISNIVLQTHINAFGTLTIASWSVYGKIDALFWMVMSAIGSSVTTFVGQNYGAGKHDRVKRGAISGLMIALIASSIISLLFMLFGEPISCLFSGDMNVIEHCYSYIQFLSPFYFTYCCVEIFSGTLRGCGEALKPMLLVCIGVCVLRVIWVTFVSPLFGTFNMVIISYPMTWSVTSILFIIYIYNYMKKRLA
ncbi:MAG: MATE family efflux transporter [Bacilli bacterium]|nr:MATE family efflux transporter [Bacilli bacterium]